MSDEKTKKAKINIAVGVAGALIAGAGIAAIILTAPFSLPAIIGVSLIGLAGAAVLIATSSRARNFLKEASSSEKVVQILEDYEEQIMALKTTKQKSLKECENKANKTNEDINAEMQKINKEEKSAKTRDAVVQDPLNRKKVDEEIKANPQLSDADKQSKRYNALNERQKRFAGIEDPLMSIGMEQENKEPSTEKKEKLALEIIEKLAKLPPDVRLNFQNMSIRKNQFGRNV